MTPEEFKRLRKDAGLTQNEAAQALGLTSRTITNYETGFHKIKPAMAEGIRKIFQIFEEGKNGKS